MPVAYDDGASPGDHVANLSGTNATFAAIVSELETARPNWVAFLDWSMDRGYILVLTDLSDFGSGYEVDHANKVIRIDNFDAGIIGGTSRTDEEMADFLYKALRDNVLLEHWGWIPEVKKIGDSMPVTYEALMIVGTLANGALDHWGGMTNIFGSQNRCYAYADAMHFSYTSELVTYPNYSVENVIFLQTDGGVYITDPDGNHIYVHVHPTYFGPSFRIKTDVLPSQIE